MKKRFSIHLYRISVLCLVLLAVVLFTPNTSSYADNTMIPHVLSTGTTQDLHKESVYKFQSDGTQLFKVVIPENGALCMQLSTAEPQTVVAEVYQKKDMSDLPIYLRAQCTVNNGNTDYIRNYFDKGTYYIRFPKNNYEVNAILYPHKNVTIKDSSVIAAYCDYTRENIYTFKAKKNGYLTVYGQTHVENGGTINSVLCNSKGKVLTENSFFNNLQKNQMTYAVKKGQTYKLKIKALNVYDTQFYQLRFKHAGINENSGAAKKKAVKIKLGQKISGSVYAEESATKADWYKITNSKKQKLILSYSGSITSGSMVFDVFDAKGNKLDSYSVISNIKEKQEASLHNKKKGLTIPKGTYYLRVTKSRKTATGIYTFSIFGK